MIIQIGIIEIRWFLRGLIASFLRPDLRKHNDRSEVR